MIEDQIENSMIYGGGDKSYIDKVLGHKYFDEIKNLMKKSPLNREDLNELLSLLSSPELKMVNFDMQERHAVLLYYSWLREFVSLLQSFYDYKDYVENNSKICITCDNEVDKCNCVKGLNYKEINMKIDIYNQQVNIINYVTNKNLKPLKKYKVQVKKIELQDRTKRVLENARIQLEKNVKFLMDMYFNVIRTSLSLSGHGFDSVLTNKFELFYPNSGDIQSNVDEKRSLWQKVRGN